MKRHRPSDVPIIRTCPSCKSYVEFYIKNMPHDPEKPFMGKCANCGKSFSMEECGKETTPKEKYNVSSH